MADIKHLVDLAQIFGPFLSVVIGFLTIKILRDQIALTRQVSESTEQFARALKSADIVQSFNLRYDQLWQVRHAPGQVEDTLSFFMRFWSLQLDQYAQWKQGFVPTRDYEVWLSQRQGDFNENWTFGADGRNFSFHKGWEHAKSKMAEDTGFVKLIESLKTKNSNIAAALKDASAAKK